MDTLLMVAVVLIALAIIVQAGILAAMYMMSRRLTDKVNGLIDDSRTLIGPLQTVSLNLQTASEELAAVGKIAHAEGETILCEIEGVRERVIETFEDARETVLQPLRRWAAIASGVAEGFRTLFGRTSRTDADQREHPAA